VEFGFRTSSAPINSLLHGVRFAFGTTIDVVQPIQVTQIGVAITNVTVQVTPAAVIEVALYQNITAGAPALCSQPGPATVAIGNYVVSMTGCPTIQPGSYVVAFMLNQTSALGQVAVDNLGVSSETYFAVGSSTVSIPSNLNAFVLSTANEASRAWVVGPITVDACINNPCASGTPGQSCTDLPDQPDSKSGRTCAACAAGDYSTDGVNCIPISSSDVPTTIKELRAVNNHSFFISWDARVGPVRWTRIKWRLQHHHVYHNPNNLPRTTPPPPPPPPTNQYQSLTVSGASNSTVNVGNASGQNLTVTAFAQGTNGSQGPSSAPQTVSIPSS